MPQPEQNSQQIDLGGCLETRLVNNLVRASKLVGVIDFDPSEYPGTLITRRGFDNWGSVGGGGTANFVKKFNTSDPTIADYFMIQRGTVLWRAPSNGATFTAVRSGLANTFASHAQFDDTAYLVNGTNGIRASNGVTWFNIGNASPQTAPVASAFGTGSASGQYAAKYSFVYGANGKYGEGPLSPISGALVIANQRIVVRNMSLGGTGVTSRRVYLTSHSALGTTYLLGSTGNNTVTRFSTGAFTEDDLLDSEVSGLSAPPASTRLVFHAGRMFYVPTSDPAQILPSKAFVPDVVDLIDAINDVRDADGAQISDMKSLGNILLILTETALWALYGANPRTWKLERIFDVGMPIGAFRTAVVINGRLFWKSRRHVYVSNGYREGTRIISLPIEQALETLNLTTTEIQKWWAVDYRPKHQYLLFVAAGTGGMVGGMSHAAPATGGIFPPPAVGLAGGVGVWNPNSAALGRATGRLCLVYDYLNSEASGEDKWVVYAIDGIAGACLNGPLDDDLLYFLSEASGTGVVHRFERPDGFANDAGSAISAKALFAPRNEGSIFQDKRLETVYIMARAFAGAGSGYHGLVKDLGGSMWVEQLTWSTLSDIQKMVAPQDSDTEMPQVYVGHSSPETRLRMEAFAPIYKMMNRR